jgi:phospho-N-acetylmuramoyl-pentapeptide-transferase
MDYLQVGIIIAMGLLISIAFTSLEIPILQNMNTGQNIREDGPESHMAKGGTPTMGGVAIILATTLTCFATREFSYQTGVVVITFIFFGLLGFFDDYLKIIKKRNLGLRAWQKLLGQVLLASVIAIYKVEFSEGGANVMIPFINERVDFGIWAIPFIIFVVVAMTNGVNLTDGLDGLASGVTFFVALFFALASGGIGLGGSGVFFSALAGACLGFLVFNKNPAKIFMGDTGSLALGGGIAAAAVMMEMELFLPIVGFIYVAESLSVIIQVVSFKTRKKRVFKMAPIHHHFELSGMKETHIVGMFWIVTLALCIIGLTIL